jgi:hypothetical protein
MIKEGDFVDIFWEHVEPEFYCKVLHVPQATGESWRLERVDGTEIYVQMFSKMTKL